MAKVQCKNCFEEFTGNFCSNCGQSAHEKRINAHYLIHDIPHSVFHVDHGFFHTLKMLFTAPGLLVRNFLEGRRAPYFRPIAYVMVMTALCTVLVKMISWATENIAASNSLKTEAQHSFFEQFFSVFIFLMIPAATLVTWLFFFNKKYNFWEHFVANTYIAAQLNIMWLLMHLVQLGAAFFAHTDLREANNLFLITFLIFFMYLYGSVFGFLMNAFYSRKFMLILTISVMNFVLSALYSTGFNLAGLVGSAD